MSLSVLVGVTLGDPSVAGGSVHGLVLTHLQLDHKFHNPFGVLTCSLRTAIRV